MNTLASAAGRLAGLVVASATLVMLSAAAAGAQTALVSSGSTTTSLAPAAAPSLSSGQSYHAALWAFGFGALAILFVLVFLWRDRIRSFETLRQLGNRGPVAVDDQGALQPDGGAPPNAAPSGGGTPELQILGPASVVVGQPMNYVVIGTPAGQTPTWVVQGAATLSVLSGPSTMLTASTIGGLHLSASAGAASGEKSLSASLPTAGQVTMVPFLGLGYGSVVIAISVASVTAALGLTGVLNGQAVAGILGSLVTYSVARGTAAAAAAGGTPITGQPGTKPSAQ